MTHQIDVARGRDTVARWCALAEQRLEYLTELFETGRWRRFHSELAFLENIQEAKTAVRIWRDLSLREASRDNPAAVLAYVRIIEILAIVTAVFVPLILLFLKKNRPGGAPAGAH